VVGSAHAAIAFKLEMWPHQDVGLVECVGIPGICLKMQQGSVSAENKVLGDRCELVGVYRYRHFRGTIVGSNAVGSARAHSRNSSNFAVSRTRW
jgi:hypothetical protein